jgi:tetratricopeptide (TPR) repeat protein
VRITAQLVDALSGGHLWAENYDREGGDVFTVIDEITIAIMNALQEKVTAKSFADYVPHGWGGTSSLKAYEKFVQGQEAYKNWNPDANLKGRRFFEEAIALDPEYALAVSLLGDTYMREISLGPEQDKEKLWGQAMALTSQAIALDENLPQPHATQAWLLLVARKYDEAIAKAEHAVSLAPGSAEVIGLLGFILHYIGRKDEAVRLADKALRLDPYPSSVLLFTAALTYRKAGLYDRAIEVGRKLVDDTPDFIFGHLILAAAYSLSGRDEEARVAAAEVLRINPNFSVEALSKTMPYKNPADVETSVNAMRKAGLPD